MMDYTLDKIKKHIITLVNKSEPGAQVDIADLSFPPNQEMGDLSLPCFNLAKKLGKAPNELAEDLLKKIHPDEIISGIKTAGPYLNFTISKIFLSGEVIKSVYKNKDSYGCNSGGNKKKVMIEYSNINTHKEFHVGHLRNISYGDAIYRILKFNGFKAISVSYVNDFGIHVAKTLWNYKDYIQKNYADQWENLSEEDKGVILGKIYADASQKEKEDPTAKQIIGGIMNQIEKRKGDEYELWKKSREWSIKSFARIYNELGVKFKDNLYENEFFEKGFKKVEDLLQKGILEKSEGAIIADLEKYNLGVLPIIRSDGSALYPVADLALASYKFEKYKLDSSIYVVDNRQSLYFKQLFKILELAGYNQETVFLGYDFVKLPTGAMSSRSGNIITYQELSKKIFARANDETKSRHPEWSERKIRKVSKAIGVGAMKFEMIKVRAGNVITFDIAKALSFEGFTSAYLQYTYARIQSVIRKAKIKICFSGSDFEKLKEDKEKNIVMQLARFPEVVEIAGNDYDSSEIAKYLFELAKGFNDYYHSVPILQAEPDISKLRILLAQATAQVLENGLSILGIEVVEEM